VVTALAGESAWSRRNRIPSGWQNNRSSDTTVRLRSPSGDVEVSYRGRRDATFAVMVSGEEEVVVRRGDVEIPGSVEFEVDGTTFAAEVSARETAEGTEWEVTTPWGHATLVEQPRFPRRAPVEIPGATRAPMPGAVALLTVEAGQPVKAGDTLCVIEAMKMEQRIVAPHDGVVGAVCVAVGDQVEADQVLMVVDGGG
jgi:biotin carboxyl carrier protein